MDPFRQVSSADFNSLETIMKSAVKEKQPFVRLEMSKEDLLKMFEVCLRKDTVRCGTVQQYSKV